MTIKSRQREYNGPTNPNNQVRIVDAKYIVGKLDVFINKDIYHFHVLYEEKRLGVLPNYSDIFIQCQIFSLIFFN